MTDFRKMIAEELREKRPNISDSSEKTYASTLFSLNKKMAGDKDLDFLKSTLKSCNSLRRIWRTNKLRKLYYLLFC